MASLYLHARFPERLRTRIVEAADAEGVSVSRWLRLATLERLGDEAREALERAELLKEARAFLAVPPGSSAVDRDAYSLVSRYVQAIEAQAGRLSLAERRGRARALAEIAAGCLEAVDGEELTFGEFTPDGPPVALELAATPRRRGRA